MTETQTASAPGADQQSSSHTWGGEIRATLKLGWPLIVAQLGQAALFTTDTFVLGQLGAKYLAAAALANALFIAVQLFGVGAVGVVAPLAAQSHGARDYRSVRRTARQGIWMAMILAVILFPIAWNIAPIYRALNQDAELVALAEVFIHVAVWLLPAAFVFVALRSFLAALGSTRVISLITFGGVIVNAIANYVLVFGHFGFPALGLVGSALSTLVVNMAMVVMAIIYIQTHRRFRRYYIFHDLLTPDWPRLIELFKTGTPIGLMLLAEVLLFTSATLLQGWIGRDEVAAHQLALTITSLTFMVPLGLSQAATVRVGLALGERNPEGVRKAGWAAMALTLGFMSLTAITFFVFPHQLVGLFLDGSNEENIRPLLLAASFLIVSGFFQLFDGGQVTMSANLRGLSDTTGPLIIALIGYWLIGFPTAWLFAFTLGFGGIGVWIGLAAGLASVAVVLTLRFSLRERFGLMNRAPV